MKKIHFEDHQQDLLWITVDKDGLIVDCNLQKPIWCGLKVYLPKLVKGKMIWFDRSEKNGLSGDINKYDFIVYKIENLKAKNRLPKRESCQG